MSAQSSAAGVPRTGFVMIDNEAIDSCDLSPRALSLYVILARHVNRESGLAWPSLDRLCALARMARATVVKYLKELESKGWIQVLRAFKPHSLAREVNRYRVLNPKREEAPAPARSGREPLAPDAPPSDPGGSSRAEPGVVQTVNEGSSNAEQPLVHELNGIQTDSESDSMNKTELNQRDPAQRAEEACADEELDAAATDRCAAPLKPTASQTRKNLAWEEFCYALADVCHLDYEANQGKIRKVASRLWKNGKGYNPIDLRTFKKWWYQQDWRGAKGDLPTLQNVSELIRAAIETPSISEPDQEDWKRFVGKGQYADIICY